jgi:hypothetical protein
MSPRKHILQIMVPPRIQAPPGAEFLGGLAAALAISARELLAVVWRAPTLHRQEPARRT